MKLKAIYRLVLAGAMLGLCGCPPPRRTGPAEPMTERMITANDLAAKLGLPDLNTGPGFARLSDGRNGVFIIAQPQKQIYVNGKDIEHPGAQEIYVKDGVVWLPEILAEAIGAQLSRPAPASPTAEPLPSPKPTGKHRTGVVVIDAGHGGEDKGAIQNGSYEKNINLKVGLQVAGLLREQGYKVVMTRQSDATVSLDKRVAIANRTKPGLFVSIHSDSNRKRSLQGYTIYTARGANAGSRRAGAALNQSMATTGLSTRGPRQARYIVLIDTTCPAVLVEMGYLSNPSEAAKLTSREFQGRIAEAIVAGIDNYFN